MTLLIHTGFIDFATFETVVLGLARSLPPGVARTLSSAHNMLASFEALENL